MLRGGEKMEYNLKIQVDEAMLRGTTEDYESSIEELISREFGWLASSGIYLSSDVEKCD